MFQILCSCPGVANYLVVVWMWNCGRVSRVEAFKAVRKYTRKRECKHKVKYFTLSPGQLQQAISNTTQKATGIYNCCHFPLALFHYE